MYRGCFAAERSGNPEQKKAFSDNISNHWRGAAASFPAECPFSDGTSEDPGADGGVRRNQRGLLSGIYDFAGTPGSDRTGRAIDRHSAVFYLSVQCGRSRSGRAHQESAYQDSGNDRRMSGRDRCDLQWRKPSAAGYRCCWCCQLYE